MFKSIRGLKMPDIEMTRYFFKSGLDKNPGKAIEFGCGNGNNLALFYEYGHEVLGIDLDANHIKDAEYNFENIFESGADYHFFAQSMNDFIEQNQGLNVDTFLLPNIINYLTKQELLDFLELSVKNHIYKDNADFFIIARDKKDARYLTGEIFDGDSSKINYGFTGEEGLNNTCYEDIELLSILQEKLNLKDYQILHHTFEWMNTGMKTFNSNIVIYGKINL